MTSLAAAAHQSRLLEQAFSPLTSRVLALVHYDHALPVRRTPAAIVGALMPVAFYLVFAAPGMWTAMHACVGSPPVL